MAIIKQYHRDTNTTYVYESEYYYDKDKKQPRSKRKLIGKIDEETGEIIPTGKRGRKKATPVVDHPHSAEADSVEEHNLQDLLKKVGERENEVAFLKARMESVEERYRQLLTEKNDTIKNLQAQVKKLEGIITRARVSLEKAMGSLDDA